MSEDINRSIAVLFKQRYDLSDSEMCSIAEKALGIPLDPPEDSTDWCLPVIEGAQYMLNKDGCSMILHNRSVPYFDDSNEAASWIQNDPELAENIRSHQGWFCADIMEPEEDGEKDYVNMCKLISHFLCENSVALFIPEYGTIIKLDDMRQEGIEKTPGLRGLGFK